LSVWGNGFAIVLGDEDDCFATLFMAFLKKEKKKERINPLHSLEI